MLRLRVHSATSFKLSQGDCRILTSQFLMAILLVDTAHTSVSRLGGSSSAKSQYVGEIHSIMGGFTNFIPSLNINRLIR